MPEPLSTPDAGSGAGGPNASVSFGQAGAVGQLAQRLNRGGQPPGGVPSGAPPAGPSGGTQSPTQPPPQMGVPQGSPLDMRQGPVTPGQIGATTTPPPRRTMAWRDGLRALADGPHGGPALRALADHADRAQGQRQQ